MFPEKKIQAEAVCPVCYAAHDEENRYRTGDAVSFAGVSGRHTFAWKA